MGLFDFIKLKQNKELFKQEKTLNENTKYEKYESNTESFVRNYNIKQKEKTQKLIQQQKLYQEQCVANAEKLYGFILRDLRNGHSSYCCPDNVVYDMMLLDEEPAKICNKLLNERLSDFDFKYKYNKIFSGSNTPNFYIWEWSLKNKNDQ